MRQLMNIMGGLLGLLVLAALVVALALTFSGLRRGAELASQSFQSPIETPTQPPYPIPTTPTHPPSKPTPLTPPATIPPKPSPPTVTVTLPPYPPPQTPIPPGTPTTVPTPQATVTPPVPGTPTAVPTSPGPLPPGPKVVYGETDSLSGATTIWLASTANPELRRALTTFVHKVGYGVQGAVSPDGSRIAYLIIPRGTSERAARTAGGELWVMNSDGTDRHRVADHVGYLAMWTPDSSALVFSRLVALENPSDPQVPFRTELYLVTADGAGQKLFLADESAYGIQPLGWSEDGQLFYYARVTLQGRWELWGVDILTGSTQFQTFLPSQYLIQSASLSPDGANVLLMVLEERQYALIVLSIDGREQRMIVRGATGDQPLNRYAAIWSPDSQDLLVHIPPEAEQPARLERFNLRTGQRHIVLAEPVSGEEFFIPRSWSPDGVWLLVLKYPRPQSLAYLLRVAGGSMAQIPLSQSSNWVTLLGWTDR